MFLFLFLDHFRCTLMIYKGMEMTTFNNQHAVSSMDDQVDDGFFDIKPFLSEAFPALSSCNSSSIPIQIPQNTINGQVKQLNITNLSSLYPAVELNQKGSAAFSSPQLISFGKSSPSLEDFERVYGNYGLITYCIISHETLNFSSLKK